jgi:hypothetical protein
VRIRREELEHWFIKLLELMEPTAVLLAQLPEIAAREWEERKVRIAADAKVLTRRRGDQTTLNQKLIAAKLNGTIDENEYKLMKDGITEELRKGADDRRLGGGGFLPWHCLVRDWHC